MSECFSGKGLTVRWSMQELGTLYYAFGILGGTLWDGFEERGVLSWFNQQRLDPHEGTMGLSLDASPADMAGPEARRFFAKLIELAAAELALQEPNPRAFGRNWVREDRLRWISRLGEMYEMIRRTSPEAHVPEYQVLLTGPDQAETQIYLYLAYFEEINMLPSANPKDRLAFIDTILTMVAEAGLERDKVDLLARLRQDRENIVEGMGLNKHRRLTDHQSLGRRAEDFAG